MRPRLSKTLTDYIVIGISPTLIMFLVGSLVFFLLTVFYHGNYSSRLAFIFALFVMATVLVARIAIEEGKEYASLFAIPLAIVTVIAMFRFVRIEGPLSAIGMPINIGLIALVWWSAHKLTWDCTLIDDAEDATGEGLLQTIGFESESGGETRAQSDAVPEDEHDSAVSAGKTWTEWWNQVVDRRRRPHAPGVWVIYFSLAALPLFGFGQWLIPQQDVASRRYAFFLMCVYVASGLALLLTTSFLGLRRYLRQRRLEMPLDMAGVWLAFGTLMIVALLLVCTVLPRPNSEIAASRFPVRFGSPDHQQTNRHAIGNDGPQQPEATRYRQDQQSGSAPTTTTTQPQQPGGKQQNRTGRGDASDQRQSGQDQGDRSGGGAQDRQGSSRGNQQDQRSGDASRRQSGEASPQRDERGQSQGGKEPRTEERGGKESKNGSDRPQGEAGQQGRSAEQGRGRKTPDDRAEQGGEGKGAVQQQPRQQRDDAGRDQRRSSPASSGRQSQPKGQRQVPPPQDQLDQAPRSQQSPPDRNLLELASRGIDVLLKLVFYAILLAGVAFLAWKYRDQIRAAILQWVEQLRQLWERLFGGQRTVSTDEESQTDSGPSWRPFSDYADPFSSGLASRYSIEQLVRYSFEAMEAWARDHGCGRQEDQTPLEFARQVARRAPHLAGEAQVLADLYSRMAYGRERIEKQRQADLRELWRQLKLAAPAEQASA